MDPRHPTSNPKPDPQPERRDQTTKVPEHTKVPGPGKDSPSGPTEHQIEHPKQS